MQNLGVDLQYNCYIICSVLKDVCAWQSDKKCFLALVFQLNLEVISSRTNSIAIYMKLYRGACMCSFNSWYNTEMRQGMSSKLYEDRNIFSQIRKERAD